MKSQITLIREAALSIDDYSALRNPLARQLRALADAWEKERVMLPYAWMNPENTCDLRIIATDGFIPLGIIPSYPAATEPILADSTEERVDGASQEPVAWMRRWAFDKETPKKVKNNGGRLVWQLKHKLLPVTEHKCMEDDVPLVARPASDEVERLRELNEDLLAAANLYQTEAGKLTHEVERLKSERDAARWEVNLYADAQQEATLIARMYWEQLSAIKAAYEELKLATTDYPQRIQKLFNTIKPMQEGTKGD